MPQAPLPALAARTSATQLATPIVTGTSTPEDVIGHFQIPNFMDAIGKGMNIGQALARLPREGAENATQKAYAEIAKEQAKAVQDQVKMIQGDKTMAPEAKTAAIEDIMIKSGYGYGPSGGTQNPTVPVGVMGRNYYIRGNGVPNAPIGNAPQSPQGTPPQPAPQGQAPQQQTPSAPQGQQNQAPASELDRRAASFYGGNAMNAPVNFSGVAQNSNGPLVAPISAQDLQRMQMLGGNLPAAPLA